MSIPWKPVAGVYVTVLFSPMVQVPFLPSVTSTSCIGALPSTSFRRGARVTGTSSRVVAEKVFAGIGEWEGSQKLNGRGLRLPGSSTAIGGMSGLSITSIIKVPSSQSVVPGTQAL